MNLISEDYLMHYGVKGMKWGVRHDPERKARKKAQKNEEYRQKLIKRSNKRSGQYSKLARESKAEYNNMKELGRKSPYWKEHLRDEAERKTREYERDLRDAGMSKESAKTWSNVFGGAGYFATYNDHDAFNIRMKDIKKEQKNYERISKRYLNNRDYLMNMKVNSFTNKKDIRKAYRHGLTIFE